MSKFYKMICLFLLGTVLGSTALQAQSLEEDPLIRRKSTLWIPKVDLFWTGAMIADGFPSFIPVELEVNFPNKHFSLDFTVSPWFETFSSQVGTTNYRSLVAGLGFRYYFQKIEVVDAATGFFIEPQFFVNRSSATFNPHPFLNEDPSTAKVRDIGILLGGGYQHLFWDKIYLHGKFSFGYTDTQILQKFRADKLIFLPWVGVGFRLY